MAVRSHSHRMKTLSKQFFTFKSINSRVLDGPSEDYNGVEMTSFVKMYSDVQRESCLGYA